MRADRARYDRRQQQLEGWGHVVVQSADGKTLKSPHIVYNQLRDSIWSDTTFEYTEADRISTGKGFTTNTKLTKRSCVRDCKATARVAIPK
jgi:LPS export ABC transporter protein LptC